MPMIPGAPMGAPEPAPAGPSGIRDVMDLVALIEAYFAEDGLDPQERVVIEDVRTKLQKLAATRQSEQEKAFGVTPQLKAMGRGVV